MAVTAAENLCAGLAGEDLPYCVNPEVFEKQLSAWAWLLVDNPS